MIENFDNLSFERKVDVLVAIYIFDYKDVKSIKEEWLGIWNPYYKEPKDYGYLLIPCYSRLLTSSWDIVRKFEYIYLFSGGKEWREGKWECKLVWDDDTSKYAWAETEMLAICYAGLKAVGYSLKDFLKEEGK